MTEYLIADHLTRKIIRRTFAKISVDSMTNCWIWIGPQDHQGYGLTTYKDRTERVHRLFYAWINGPIPRGVAARREAQVDHTCRNPSCCNPAHLELVTQKVNVLRGIGPSAINARKTHCKYGHLLGASKDGSRKYCRTCDSIRKKSRMKGPNREYWLEKARQAAKRYKDKRAKK